MVLLSKYGMLMTLLLVRAWKDSGLRSWWDLLVEIGPLYGYLLNGSKTHVLAKPHHVEAAKEIFKGTGIVISTEGERYLGGALGTPSFVRQYVKSGIPCE